MNNERVKSANVDTVTDWDIDNADQPMESTKETKHSDTVTDDQASDYEAFVTGDQASDDELKEGSKIRTMDDSGSDDPFSDDEFKEDHYFMAVGYESDKDEEIQKKFKRYHELLVKHELVGPYANWVRESTVFAINRYNRINETNLELVEIKKANFKFGGGYVFFITFDAVEISTGDLKTYQTQVYYGIMNFHGKTNIKVRKFRQERPVDQSPCSWYVSRKK